MTAGLAIDASAITALADRGHAHLGLGESNAALADFSAALEQMPTFAEGYFGRGLVYLHQGRQADAEDEFRQAVQCAPGEAENLRVRWLLAEAASFTARNASKRPSSSATRCSKTRPRPLRRYGCARVANWYSDQLVEAADDYTQILSLAEDAAAALSARGQVYAEMGEFELALADLDRALALAERQDADRTLIAYTLGGRGLTLAGLGRFDEALTDFERSVAQAPDNAWVYYDKGVVFDKMKETTKAAICLKLSLQLRNPH